jgi:hypothetical protein
MLFVAEFYLRGVFEVPDAAGLVLNLVDTHLQSGRSMLLEPVLIQSMTRFFHRTCNFF